MDGQTQITRNVLSRMNEFYIPELNIIDCIEMALIIVILYRVITGLKHTRALVLARGVSIVAIVYALAYIFRFDVMLAIFDTMIPVMAFIAITIFQPEIRKFIEDLGNGKGTSVQSIKDFLRFKTTKPSNERYSDATINAVRDAVDSMSKVKTGALIVFEMDTPLDDYIKSGIPVNGDVSSGLLINIFEKNTPLHDGAVVIAGDKVSAATCYLPLTQNPNVPKHLGTRHRAAIGVSEQTDSVIITVSEETGAISYVANGKIKYKITADEAVKLLKKAQLKEEVTEEEKMGFLGVVRKNLGLKVSCMLSGIIIWVLAINIANPTYIEVVKHVPVTILHGQSITEAGKTFATDLTQADVRVIGSRRDVQSIRTDDVAVLLDLDNMSITNSVKLEVMIDGQILDGTGDIRAEVVGSGVAKVELDDIVEKDFTVEKRVTGNLPSGMAISSLVASIDTVKVTGASKEVDKIEKVVASLNMTSGDIDGKSDTVAIRAYDKKGKAVELNNSQLAYSECNMTATLLPMKEVPIDVKVNEENSSREYKISKITYGIERVYIYGAQEELDKVNAVDISMGIDDDEINIVNNAASVEINLNEYLPYGVDVVVNENLAYSDDMEQRSNVMQVKIEFSQYKTRGLTLNKSDIAMAGLNNNYNVNIATSSVNFNIYGIDEEVDSVTIDEISPTIDLTEIGIGSHIVPVSLSLPGTVKVDGEPVAVSVVITSKYGETPVQSGQTGGQQGGTTGSQTSGNTGTGGQQSGQASGQTSGQTSGNTGTGGQQGSQSGGEPEQGQTTPSQVVSGGNGQEQSQTGGQQSAEAGSKENDKGSLEDTGKGKETGDTGNGSSSNDKVDSEEKHGQEDDGNTKDTSGEAGATTAKIANGVKVASKVR